MRYKETCGLSTGEETREITSDHHWEKAVRGQHYQERQGAITGKLPEDKWVVSYKFLQNLTGSACKSLPLTL